MLWLEQKYIGIISSRLERFRRNNNTYNFRCPICGDSQRNKSKARGFLFIKDDGHYLYHCHNCHVTMGLDKFIQSIDAVTHDEFIKEKLTSTYTPSGKRIKTDVELFADKMKKPKFISATPLKVIKKISQLGHNHPAKKYVVKRGIPNPYHAKLFYAPKFKSFVNSVLPGKFESTDNDEPRLIIPFLDENKDLFGFQGRSFSKKGLRYITIMLNQSMPKIFGLEDCDRTKTHFILEGPIDSMFVDNSIAMAGSSIDYRYVNENSVFVFDNEPRSAAICDKISNVIDKGYKVSLFPEHLQQKDINDMILSNPNIDIQQVLTHNVSSGLEAKILFTAWKRI